MTIFRNVYTLPHVHVYMYIAILLCVSVQVQSHPLTPDELENLLQNPATLRSEYKVS